MENLDQLYQAALDYMYSYVDFSRTHQEDLGPDDFDLSRMWSFMAQIGSPQDDYPTIHVAGSKGKGSVSAFCASVLKTAGYKVGLYTSPHLKDFEERIQVDLDPISRRDLVDLIEELKPYVDQVPGLTTFEIMTGLMYLHFSRQEVDIAIIEVGLGGRLDATNVITPQVSVITSLYLDHITILGDKLEQIAAEKGGIIKPEVPVVSAPQKEIAAEVLRGIAEENRSPLVEVENTYSYQIQNRSLEGQSFIIHPQDSERELELFIPLLGDFQVINAVTAVGALDQLSKETFPYTEQDIQIGFRQTDWPARFEILQEHPPIIVDSAHNPASIKKLTETIDQYFPDYPLYLIFGISEDKQLQEMYENILPRTAHLICTASDHPRAMPADELAAAAAIFSVSAEAVPDVAQALKKAIKMGPEEKIVLVTGSIFVAASGRIAWFEAGH